MPVWCVTGKLGAGKTLVAVSRIKKYLQEGRRVATNLDLQLENFGSPFSKSPQVYRLPDIPTLESFKAIGKGYDGQLKSDDSNGLVVLDECALWLNSRSWNDKARKPLIDYFVHLRKLRWDLIIIIQDESALDSQFRALYCEHTVFCSRADRFSIPIIGWFLNRMNGGMISLPKVHIGTVMYNAGHGQTKVDTWIYRGTDLYNCYDTEQGFQRDNTGQAIYQYLTPWHIKGRYIDKLKYLKEKLSTIKVTHLFLIGLLCGGAVAKAFTPTMENPERGTFFCNSDWELLFGDCELSVQQVREAVDQYKQSKGATVKDSSDKPLVAESDEPQQEAHPLDGLYITASVKFDSGQYEYYFEKDGQPVSANKLGYRVYDKADCTAVLVNYDNPKDYKDVFCK
jgi:hypothetical protein